MVFFLATAGAARAERPLPLHLFAGSDLGWSTVSPYAYPEGDRSGMDFDLKLLGSAYIQKHWIVDLGGGWQYTKRSGENLTGGFSKVITKGTVIEGAVRYGNFTGWQFGPVLNAILVGDVGLGNGNLVESQAQNATLAGIQAFYEWPERDFRVRVGGRWMTDLNVDNRTVNVYQAGVEIGIPLWRDPVAGPRLVRRPGIQIVQKDRSLKRVRLVLDARRIEFDYDQATLRPEAAARLARLGQFLAKSKENWEHLRISGHTDERGSVEYNQTLSENRAAAVKAALVAQGVPREKMETRGYSELQPIDPGHNEAAWQRNRRVEFEFTGVQDLDLIVDGVNQATTDDAGDEANP
ncbi:MAG: OmpA family protein [Bdellovibrionales bacterium]|nr:OmpA family protein [Bdellovibrionales bacterium]